ncbi:tetratricopeptide repeat protein [Mucilaginibacter sp. AW1-3]
MKKVIHCLLILLLLSVYLKASAQSKTNDALLLDMYQNQRYIEAAAYLKSVYPEPVTDNKVLSRLAYTYQMAGKLPDAEAYYLRIYQTDSTSVPILFNLANVNLNRGNNPKAIVYLKKIVTIDSTNFMVYKQLGRLSSDPAESLKYLQIANNLNPEDDVVAASLGSQLINLKQFKQAQKILTRALVADSTDLILLKPMLALTFELKRYNEVIRAGTNIMAVGDNSYPVISKVAESYFFLKNYQCCIETFAVLPEIFQSESSYYFTAESYKALKDYPRAVPFFELTLKQSISPNTNRYYAELADTYDEMHQVKNTIANYQKSLFFKEDGLICYSLANLYDTKLMDKKNALKYYKKYLDSKPPEKQQEYITYTQSRITQLKNK